MLEENLEARVARMNADAYVDSLYALEQAIYDSKHAAVRAAVELRWKTQNVWRNLFGHYGVRPGQKFPSSVGPDITYKVKAFEQDTFGVKVRFSHTDDKTKTFVKRWDSLKVDELQVLEDERTKRARAAKIGLAFLGALSTASFGAPPPAPHEPRIEPYDVLYVNPPVRPDIGDWQPPQAGVPAEHVEPFIEKSEPHTSKLHR